MEPADTWVKLVGALAWPVTILVASAIFYRPLSGLVEIIAKRITRFSAFKVKIDLGGLAQARSLSATVESLKKVAIEESGFERIVAGAIKTGSADYVLIGIGGDDEQNWITSRLFLLAAILERSRIVRCVVFLGENQRFLGAATPRDLRIALAARFPEYDSALAAAYGSLGGLGLDAFRGGISEPLVDALGNSFLRNALIVARADPNPKVGWVKLERKPPKPTTWEFADWLTAGSIRDIVGQHLMQGFVIASAGPATSEVTKKIVAERGSFVALVDQGGAFRDLSDRHVVVESIAREAMEQSAPAEEGLSAKKKR